jgi:acyl carrier protein
MTLHAQVAQIIIEAVELEDFTAQDFPYGSPLFDSDENGLGFDSVTSLEIVSRLAETFPLDFDGIGSEDLSSVNAIVRYIERKRAELQAS